MKENEDDIMQGFEVVKVDNKPKKNSPGGCFFQFIIRLMVPDLRVATTFSARE